jgi:membrane protein DedA with SNARE-associated domain
VLTPDGFRYSIAILPALVVAEQIGIPLPAVPALLAVGALAAHGRVSLVPVLTAIVVVALTVDLGWYELGRRRVARVLARLCRLSLDCS